MKKTLVLFLTLLMCIGTMVSFADAEVKLTYGEILRETGLIKGTDKGLEEEKNLTRQEMIAILNKLYANKSAYEAFVTPASPSFSDVPVTHWAYRDIEFAKSVGITNGMGDGSFGLNKLVSANQATIFFSNILGYKDFDGKVSFDKAYTQLGELLGLKSKSNISGTDSINRGVVFELMANALTIAGKNEDHPRIYMLVESSKFAAFLKSYQTAVLFVPSDVEATSNSGDVTFSDLKIMKTYNEITLNSFNRAKKLNFKLEDQDKSELLNRVDQNYKEINDFMNQYLIPITFSESRPEAFSRVFKSGEFVNFRVFLEEGKTSPKDLYFMGDSHYLSLDPDTLMVNDKIESSEGNAKLGGRAIDFYSAIVGKDVVYLCTFEDDGETGLIAVVMSGNTTFKSGLIITSYGSAISF